MSAALDSCNLLYSRTM